MSIRATADSAVDRHRPRPSTSPLREDAQGAERSAAVGDVASQLVRYIPAEVVAAYITVAGVLPLPGSMRLCAGDFTARWIAFAAFAILTPVTLQVLYVVKRRAADGVGPTVPGFEHVAALAAFVAWALMLPLSPMSSWCDWQPQYGVAIGATMLLLLGLAAQLFRPQR
jgi:hypothetical protein